MSEIQIFTGYEANAVCRTRMGQARDRIRDCARTAGESLPDGGPDPVREAVRDFMVTVVGFLDDGLELLTHDFGVDSYLGPDRPELAPENMDPPPMVVMRPVSKVQAKRARTNTAASRHDRRPA